MFGNRKEIQVTNDGATILKNIGVDNAAAKVLTGGWCCFYFLSRASFILLTNLAQYLIVSKLL